jgi:hypothetical protein
MLPSTDILHVSVMDELWKIVSVCPSKCFIYESTELFSMVIAIGHLHYTLLGEFNRYSYW